MGGPICNPSLPNKVGNSPEYLFRLCVKMTMLSKYLVGFLTFKWHLSQRGLKHHWDYECDNSISLRQQRVVRIYININGVMKVLILALQHILKASVNSWRGKKKIINLVWFSGDIALMVPVKIKLLNLLQFSPPVTTLGQSLPCAVRLPG